jgi:hypothetical protein
VLESALLRCGVGKGEAIARGSISGERWCGPWFHAPQAKLMVHGDGFLAETPSGLVLHVICSASSAEGRQQIRRFYI